MRHPICLAAPRTFTAWFVCAATLLAGGAITVAQRQSGGREWRDYAGGPESSRFVDAMQITKDNVHQLEVA